MAVYKNGQWQSSFREGAEQEESDIVAWKDRVNQKDKEYWAKKEASRTEGAATATLVLGILSFFLIPLAVGAFITATQAVRNGSRTAGLVCAWVNIVLYGAALAYIVYAVNAVSSSPYN